MHIGDVGYEVRPARPDEYASVAELIAEANARPETQCLHSDDRAEVAAARLAEFAKRGDGRVVVALQSGSVAGALAADVDEEAGRAWLWGPFATRGRDSSAGDDFEGLSAAMLACAADALPAAVTQVDAFPNERNERCERFYRASGFVEHARHHIYVARRAASPSPEGVVEADASLTASAAALHDAEFPDTYMKWEDLVAKSGGRHRLFVVLEHADGALEAGPEPRVAGYLFAERFEEDGEGFIHYLAVEPHARGRGVGRRLVEAALHWLFDLEGAPSAHLAVTAERLAAQRLYERGGFERILTGVALRRAREP